MSVVINPIGKQFTTRTNYCANPSFEVQGSTSGWSPFTTCSLASIHNVARLTDNVHHYSLQVTNTAAAAADTGPVWGTGKGGASAAPGDVWTASCYFQAATTGRTVEVHLAWFDATGASLGNVVGASVVDATTGWVRASVTATAPANTAYVGVIPYITACGANEAHYVEDVLLEKSGTLGSYFDGGSDPNAYYTAGGYGPAVLRIYTQTQAANPHWPTLDVRAWLDDNPFPPGGNATSNAALLSDRIVSGSVSRGRQYELDQDEGGTATFRVDNRDGVLFPGQPGIKPLRDLAVRAWWQGQKYDLFAGFVERWPTQAEDPSLSWSSIEATDTMAVLAQRQMRSMTDEAHLSASVPPTVYYPLSEAQGSQTAANIAAGGTAYPPVPLVNYKGGPTDNTPGFGATSPSINDPETMFAYANASGAANKGTQLQISGPQNPNGPSLDFTKPWLVSLTFSATGGKTVLWSALSNDGQTVLATIEVDAVANTVRMGCNFAANNGQTWQFKAGELAQKGGLPVAFGWDGGPNLLMYFYGGKQSSPVVAYTPPASTDPHAVSSWLAMGQCFNSTVIILSSQANITYGRVAMWLGGTLPTDQDMRDINDGSQHAWSGDAGTARINRVLKWCGQPSLAGDPSASYHGPMQDPKNSSALDVIRTAALDEAGRVVTAVNGQMEFMSRWHNAWPGTAVYTFGSNTGAGELPYTAGPGFALDPQFVYNDVQITQPDGTVGRWTDPTSLSEYFQRVLQANANYYYSSDALYAAQWLVQRYKEPVARVEELVLDPGSNPALWPAVLSMDLGTLVQINHRSVGAPTLSMLAEVQHIKHEVSAGSNDSPPSWRTTVQVTPLLGVYWILAAMHTTIAATVAAGVSSVTLNPLPDSGTNPAEASLGQGTTITLSPGTANAETMTIQQVQSQPTAGATGYTSILVTFTAATAHPHTAGDYACDPLPSQANNDPTFADSRSTLGTNTLTSY